MASELQISTPAQGSRSPGGFLPNVVNLACRRPKQSRQQHVALNKGQSYNLIATRAARGTIEASGANGTTGSETVLELADRQASSSTAGPSHSSTPEHLAQPIRQHSVPEGNPNLATLVSHQIAPA